MNDLKDTKGPHQYCAPKDGSFVAGRRCRECDMAEPTEATDTSRVNVSALRTRAERSEDMESEAVLALCDEIERLRGELQRLNDYIDGALI